MWHVSIKHGHMDAILTTLIGYIVFKIIAKIKFTFHDIFNIIVLCMCIKHWHVNIYSVLATLGFTLIKYLSIYSTKHDSIIHIITLSTNYLLYNFDNRIMLLAYVLNWIAINSSKYAYKTQNHNTLTNMTWLKISITSIIEYLVNDRKINLVELVPIILIFNQLSQSKICYSCNNYV